MVSLLLTARQALELRRALAGLTASLETGFRS